MSAPTTITDANGRLVSVGNGVALSGVVTAVNATTGVATIELTDAYATLESSLATVTINCYNIREQKIKS